MISSSPLAPRSSFFRGLRRRRAERSDQYEIFCEAEGWRWRFVDIEGRVLAAAPRPLTRERCMTAVRILCLSRQAPVLIRSGKPGQGCGNGETGV